MPLQLLGRRRKIILASTALPAAAVGVMPPRAVLVRRPPARPRARPAIAGHEAIGATPPPPPPPPPIVARLRPAIAVVKWSPQHHRPFLAIQSKDRVADLDATPNIVVVARPARRAVRPRPAQGASASPHVMAIPPARPLLVPRRGSIPGGRPGYVRQPPASIVVVPRAIRPIRPGVVVTAWHPAHYRARLAVGAKGRLCNVDQTPNVLLVPRPVPLRRPAAIARHSGAAASAGSRGPVASRPVLVARPVRRARFTPFLGTLSEAPGNATAGPQMRRPGIILVPNVRRVARVPSALSPAMRHRLASPAIAGPSPLVLVAGRLRARPPSPAVRSTPPPAIVVSVPQPIPTVNPPTPGGSVVPPDLVAACIAWLRLHPAIVAAFGDTAAAQKFGSDLHQRDTDPPYLSFMEPDEDEGYETVDASGLPSSLCTGTLALEVCGGGGSRGKLYVRQLAELVVKALNDAPLTFQDGNLVYLRRNRRKFPVFKEPGPQGNVQIYKRILEFDYHIERTVD
jgi:hypothetical protein